LSGEAIDRCLLRGLREEPDSLFVDVRYVCDGRRAMWPAVMRELAALSPELRSALKLA
jgi:hypothetical protein